LLITFSIFVCAGLDTCSLNVRSCAIAFAIDVGAAVAEAATNSAVTMFHMVELDEIYGSNGSLKFSFEDMNVLWYFDNTTSRDIAGFKRILVTEENHPYLKAWWPPGHVLGYEHTFTHEIMDFVQCIVEDKEASPSFADGLQIQKVLAAVEKSSLNNGLYEKI
jgi:predicted dehydrogenase